MKISQDTVSTTAWRGETTSPEINPTRIGAIAAATLSGLDFRSQSATRLSTAVVTGREYLWRSSLHRISDRPKLEILDLPKQG